MVDTPEFSVNMRHGADAETVFELAGELDLDTSEVLRRDLLPEVERGTVVVDLSRLEFCDSSGLRALIEAGRRARKAGRAFRLAAPADAVARVLEITGADGYLPVFPDVENALRG